MCKVFRATFHRISPLSCKVKSRNNTGHVCRLHYTCLLSSEKQAIQTQSFCFISDSLDKVLSNKPQRSHGVVIMKSQFIRKRNELNCFCYSVERTLHLTGKYFLEIKNFVCVNHTSNFIEIRKSDTKPLEIC